MKGAGRPCVSPVEIPAPPAPPCACPWAGVGGEQPRPPLRSAPPCRSRRQPAAAPQPSASGAARRARPCPPSPPLPCPMGSLLSGVSFKEPTTVEDCDSTWETDSEPEAVEKTGEPPARRQQQQEGVCTAAGGGEEEPAELPAADRRPQEPPPPPSPPAEEGERAEADAASPEQVPPGRSGRGGGRRPADRSVGPPRR